ncbi:MAG: GNAT family N-acetyltransferase [Thermoguttaceae bacterium]|jgi:predicted acetyltransferase
MSQEDASSPSADATLPKTIHRRVRLPLVSAKACDHAAIQCFLHSVFQAPSPAEFQAVLDDPFYEPRDRLLLRHWRQIVAHVQIAHRTMLFGPARLAVASLGWLGVAAEHRGHGLGTHLLREAESQMRADGALLGMIRTSIPRFFRQRGWTTCGQPSYRRANACAIRARLLESGMIPRPKRRLHIRPWLQWEQGALARIYASHDAYGPLERTDAYWQWLLARHGYDEVYVALQGPELLELGEVSTHVVGYAATRGEQIVELMTAPDRPRAAAELLARCCGDAIENDRHCVLLHAEPSHALFRIFDEAAGPTSAQTPEQGEVCMVRLLDPLELLRRLADQFDRRATEAGLRRPSDLGLMVDGRKYRLEFNRRGVAVESQHVGRSYLGLNTADLTRLLLGQLDFDAAVADGRIECSSALAREAGSILFPPLPFWRPLWDDLPAS